LPYLDKLTFVVEVLALVIGAVGLVVISWGVLSSFVELLGLEYRRLRRVNICTAREILRHHLGSYLLLGLEVLIAADIIHTLARRTLTELAILGGIVAIRTVLSVFLNMELKSDGHSCGGARAEVPRGG
jgi:uncharacterized membrane protein